MKFSRLFSFMVVCLVCGMADAQQYIYICKDKQYTRQEITDFMELSLLTDCDSITFDVPQFPTETIDGDTVYVTYSGVSATVQIPSRLASVVTATTNGGHVTITNTNTSEEIPFCLSGSTSDGSLTYNGSYKTTIVLNGVSITNPSGAAIDIQDGKRIALELADGTTNVLADGADGSQKAALYCKGHLEVSKGGALTIKGNTKHALSSKEYVLLKKTMGSLTITSAASDGIHAGQYFQMNGGTVTVSGVGGDAIQAEATGDEGDEDDGQLIVKDGTLNLTVTADDKAALKSDSLMTISGGNITINVTGNGSKGLKSGTDINVTDGTLDITNSGGTYEDTEEDDTTTPTTTSYKVYVTLPTNGGGGGPGGGGGMNNGAWKSVYLYKSDGTLVQQLTNTVTKTSGYGSATFYYYDFKAADTGTYYFKSDDYTSRGGFGGGGTYTIVSSTFTGPSSGSDVYYTITNSYSTSGSTRTYSINNTTSTWANGSTSSSEGDLASSHGIKADGTITVDGGTTTLTITGTAGKGFSADTGIVVNGGNITIANSGAGLVSGSETYTSKGFTSDGFIALNGGTIGITMKGTGGKGVKSDGALTIGTEDGAGPALTVSTSGSKLSTGSSGGGGGWGGMQESSGSSAKGIKAQGTITIYGGELNVSTATDGAEGLESKTSVDIRGGLHYFKCYDDCINSNGNIYFNGGSAICYSNGNDAVDSNAGRTGAITIGNGNIFAFTTEGSPEEGLDCDNNSYIQITGSGIAVSAGGSQGGGGGGWGGGSSSSSISNAYQGYAFVTSSISYSSGRYYTLSDASGNNLVTYSFPASCSCSLALFTAPGMLKGSTYYVKYSTTKPTDATTVVGGGSGQAGLYIGSSATGTGSVTSFTAQ